MSTQEEQSAHKASPTDISFEEAKVELQPENDQGLMTQIFGDSDDEPDRLPARKSNPATDPKPDQDTQAVPRKLTDFEKTGDIELFLKNKKLARRRKPKMDDAYKAKLGLIASNLVQQMLNAARDDRVNLELKQPALEKIKIVDSVKASLLRQCLHPYLVEHDVFTAIAEWLDLLPNGSLPNIKIRNELLAVLESWPNPSMPALERSGLAYSLSNLAGHPNEVPSFRTKVSQLLFKWTKPEVKPRTDDERIEMLKRGKLKKVVEKTKKLDPINITPTFKKPIRIEDREQMTRARAVEPVPDNVDYIIRPPSVGDVDASASKYLKHMKDMEVAAKFVRKLRRKR